MVIVFVARCVVLVVTNKKPLNNDCIIIVITSSDWQLQVSSPSLPLGHLGIAQSEERSHLRGGLASSSHPTHTQVGHLQKWRSSIMLNCKQSTNDEPVGMLSSVMASFEMPSRFI